jgi:lysozyme family protein
MAKSFNDALQVILKHEGGYVNNPLDRGGATNFGITQKVYEAYKNRPVTIKEIQSMSLSDVRSIYKKSYWDKLGGDAIKFYSVALALFDQGVNRGTVPVVKQVQKVLGITQDGKMGQTTMNALNSTSEASFLPKFFAESDLAYKTIVERNPSQQVFAKSWSNRLKALASETSKWLGTLNKTTIGIGLVIAIAAAVGAYFYMKGKKK